MVITSQPPQMEEFPGRRERAQGPVNGSRSRHHPMERSLSQLSMRQAPVISTLQVTRALPGQLVPGREVGHGSRSPPLLTGPSLRRPRTIITSTPPQTPGQTGPLDSQRGPSAGIPLLLQVMARTLRRCRSAIVSTPRRTLVRRGLSGLRLVLVIGTPSPPPRMGTSSLL